MSSDDSITEDSLYDEIMTIQSSLSTRLLATAPTSVRRIINRTMAHVFYEVYQSVWEFENFGSIRAHKLNDMFFTAKLHQPTVFTYDWIQGGAVHHGKWTCHMKDLLAKENIKIDFEKRGFDTDYVEPIETPSKNQVYSPRVSVIFKTLFSDRKLFAKKVKDRLHFLFSNRKSLK